MNTKHNTYIPWSSTIFLSLIFWVWLANDFSTVTLVCITGCSNPTDLFIELEGKPNTVDLLCCMICKQYPNISVSHPMRLCDTINRIAGPTRPLLRGPAKLDGLPLASYRKRVWKPHTRTTQTPDNNNTWSDLILSPCTFRWWFCISRRVNWARHKWGDAVYILLSGIYSGSSDHFWKVL